ncbi:hypothetical protein RA2_02689 [Roseovarius sp. A-2]|uniref:DUF2059 domain-containing protein n=1 Tax=Roseovarius sp. A-2 TaxID=1570360 RepID=UPI0009B57AC3|nr:DUF2059 domain-containing protein [Roseovarius sp. A-2]GAW35625.1 hypothetical protein RA2_02689 [Roseovarius sp. A-2]
MRVFTGLVLALCLALPAHAQSDRDARLAVAKEYVAATMEGMDMQDFIRQIWQPMVDQMAQNRQHLTPDQIARIETLFSEELTEPLTEVMHDQDEILADLLTLQELEALRDFYNSEHGHAVMEKMPRLAQIQQPMISRVLQAKMPVMMPKIREITTGETE